MVTTTNTHNALPSTVTSAAAKATVSSGTPELSQGTFLKLMLAQMKNQDPFKPQDPAQFLSQLAQFSQVQGIQTMQQSLDTLTGAMRSSQVLEGTSLVGRNVLAAGNVAQLDAGGVVRGAVQAPDGTSGIDVTVRNASGALVNRFTVPPGTGLTEFSWDGSTISGGLAAPGQYRIDTTARFGNSNESVVTLLQSRVTSVTVASADGAMALNTPIGSLALSDVRRVM